MTNELFGRPGAAGPTGERDAGSPAASALDEAAWRSWLERRSPHREALNDVLLGEVRRLLAGSKGSAQRTY